MNEYLPEGKMSVLIDGQLGSTGKGLLASWIGRLDHIDVAISNGAPNAGHTFFDGHDGPYVARHLPVSALVRNNRRSTIYLCAGAIIDPDILNDEVERLNVDPSRIVIHPRAAVITEEDRIAEGAGSGPGNIASTGKGVGSALSRKIMRTSGLAVGDSRLKGFTIRALDLDEILGCGCVALIEVPQGVGLGINSGTSYPHCTSREISVSQSLSDAQIHPGRLGAVLMTVRAHPIRVGNVYDSAGRMTGFSGPFPEDSSEITWDELNVDAEVTTVSRRVRRVATFSKSQYARSVALCEPDIVLLNFVNYCDADEYDRIVEMMEPHKRPTHVAIGPRPEDVFEV